MVQNCLISNIGQNILIVMDSGRYHSRHLNKASVQIIRIFNHRGNDTYRATAPILYIVNSKSIYVESSYN